MTTAPRGVSAVSWAPGRIDLFWVGADGGLVHRVRDGQLWNRYWDGVSWHDWETLGGELTGTPAASSWAADRIDVWAPGLDGTIWHRWWDGTRWVEWERLPAR